MLWNRLAEVKDQLNSSLKWKEASQVMEFKFTKELIYPLMQDLEWG
jgi:hypothetical protein